MHPFFVPGAELVFYIFHNRFDSERRLCCYNGINFLLLSPLLHLTILLLSLEGLAYSPLCHETHKLALTNTSCIHIVTYKKPE